MAVPRPDDMLAQLRDIHLPLPLEAAWVAAPIPSGVLLLLALLAVASAIYRWRRRRLRAALGILKQLARRHAGDGDATRLAAGLAALLRQQAMRCFPAHAVAGLVDDEWLGFLDAHGGDGEFRHGAGAALASQPYRPAAGAAEDAGALLAVAERWLRANPG